MQQTMGEHNTQGGEPSQQTTEHKARNPRACEPCRVRKTKCTGGRPCSSCRQLDRVSACTVRLKSRPNRAIPQALVSSRIAEESNERSQRPIASPAGLTGMTNPFDYRLTPSIVDRCSPANVEATPVLPRSPGQPRIGLIDELGAQWADRHGLNVLSFSLGDQSPLTADQPIPATNTEVENELIEVYLRSSKRHFDGNDRQAVRALYARYAALPESLGEDQCGLLHACMNRSTQLHGDLMRAHGTYYFHLALKELDSGGRSSITAIAALLLLCAYASSHGGKEDTLDVLRRTSGHIRAMGLLRWRLASLYPASDQVGRLLTAFIYLDTLAVIHLDHSPHILWSELDWDPSEGTDMVKDWTMICMRLETDFYSDPIELDGSRCLESVLQTETKWQITLRSIISSGVRPSSGTQFPPSRGTLNGWSVIRINWLMIILRAPLTTHNLLGGSSWTAMTRAAVQILRIYADLNAADNLYPAWLQLQRLSTCCQLLLLATDQGLLHPMEAGDLLLSGIDMFRKHVFFWPEAGSLAHNFSVARKTLLRSRGFSTANSPVPAAEPASLQDMQESPTDLNQMAWPALELDWESLLADDGNKFLEDLLGDPVLQGEEM